MPTKHFHLKYGRIGVLIACVAFWAALVMALLPAPASAQIAPNHVATYRLQGIKDATASSTFATTSYADLAAATVTFNPIVDPNATYAPGTPAPTDYIHASFSADVTKATATTGTCAVYANGAIVTKTARSVSSSAGQASISGDFYIPNTTTGSQTVKLQCKSGDTNTLTVNNAHLVVEEIF